SYSASGPRRIPPRSSAPSRPPCVSSWMAVARPPRPTLPPEDRSAMSPSESAWLELLDVLGQLADEQIEPAEALTRLADGLARDVPHQYFDAVFTHESDTFCSLRTISETPASERPGPRHLLSGSGLASVLKDD